MLFSELLSEAFTGHSPRYYIEMHQWEALKLDIVPSFTTTDDLKEAGCCFREIRKDQALKGEPGMLRYEVGANGLILALTNWIVDSSD